MIYLKKNDKLIIIIAVVVIIIAAAGLAAYNPPEDDGSNGETGGMITYDVSWPTHTKTVNLEEELYAGRNAPYSEEVTIGDENILKVTIEISWQDNSVFGIIRTKGADTLMAEVTYKGTTESWESVFNGTYEFDYTINDLPYETTVEGKTETEALDMLNEEYNMEDSLTFTIDVNVQPGEPRYRPLKYRGDPGNDFMLKITYEYYYASLDENGDEIDDEQETGGDFDFTGENEDPAYLGILINAGLTRW